MGYEASNPNCYCRQNARSILIKANVMQMVAFARITIAKKLDTCVIP